MKKLNYAGDRHAQAVPPQAEAQAYFNRMTAAPSKLYRDAINLAVYEWKQQGNWSLLKGLWLLCADTAQAAALSVISDTARDMTLNGAPTFTALKGYSDFDTTAKQLVFPITSTILANDNFWMFFAGLVDSTHGISEEMIVENATDASGTSYGNAAIRVVSGGHGQFFSGGRCPVGAPLDLIGTICVGSGGPSQSLVTCGWSQLSGGSSTARGSNYKTGNVAPPHPCTRFTALAYLGSAATTRMAQRFLITLTKLLDTLGALD